MTDSKYLISEKDGSYWLLSFPEESFIYLVTYIEEKDKYKCTIVLEDISKRLNLPEGLVYTKSGASTFKDSIIESKSISPATFKEIVYGYNHDSFAYANINGILQYLAEVINTTPGTFEDNWKTFEKYKYITDLLKATNSDYIEQLKRLVENGN